MFDVFKKANRRASVTDELLIDIYASPDVNGLAIVIDRPFQKTLQRLELDLKDKHLIFVFDGEKKDLGVPLKSDLVPFFVDRQQIKFNIVEKESLTLINSFMIPFNVIDESA